MTAMAERSCDWALILHGGAKVIEAERADANRAGCLVAAEAGREVLARGGTAVEAVEAVIRVLEDDPTFNAAYGAVLNADGAVQLDAALMDGADLALGGVAGTTGLRHPISVARTMLTERPVLLTGEGARRFAEKHGHELCDPDALISPEQRAGKPAGEHDTVGAVAIDRRGNVAAGTSTGGLPGSAPGRVGDSPLAGAGLYAENGCGGVSLSGDGESIVRLRLASRIMQNLEGLAPDAAIAAAVERMPKVGGEAGAIVIDRQGRIGWGHNSPHFAVAMVTSAMSAPRAWLSKDEEAAADD